MGPKRTFLFCGLMYGLAVLLLGPLNVQAQSAQNDFQPSAQNAYYQPLTQGQNQQHVQAIYDDNFRPQPDPITPAMQQRAARMLKREQPRAQRPSDFKGFPSSPLPSRIPAIHSGFGRQQQQLVFTGRI